MSAKRFLMVGYDLLFAVLLSCVALLAWTQPAYAYVDPSVMTYTIQALAGVAVALSAVLGVVWRRTRKKLLNVLHIDENANKEIEPDVHRIDPLNPAATVIERLEGGQVRSGRPSTKRGAERARLSWVHRLGFALLASASLSFTVLVVAPYEIVAGGSSSLIFGLSDVWAPLAAFAAVVAVVVALVLSVLRGKAFDVAFALIVALVLSAYVQTMFLNSALPAADGSVVVWDDYTAVTVLSSAAWIAIIVACVVLAVRKRELFRNAAVFASIALIVVQSVGVASLWIHPESASAGVSTQQDKEVRVTEEGLFDVSSKSNVVVFVLDTFDTADLNRLLESDPSTLDEFTGFTFFQNSVGSMIPTRYGVPYLLTGELPKTDESFSHFLEDQYPRSDFLDDIKDEGYSIGIYSDSIEKGTEYVADKTVNMHSLGDLPINEEQTILMLGKCALYRDLPWLLKPPFWFYTDEVNDKVSSKDKDDFENISYTMNDVGYYNSLVSNGLSLTDDDAEGCFRFIHLAGAHGPYIMDENAEAAGSEGSTLDQQCRGSLKIVGEYIQQMKDLGVYDTSTIVVTADHGYWGIVDYISSPTSPILLVKPASGEEESAEPYRMSTVPTGHVDYPATIIDAVGGDSSKYGSTVFGAPDADRARYYYMTASDGKDDTFVRELRIDGDVLDFDNWQFTENEWDCTR